MNLKTKFENGKIPEGFTWLHEPESWSIQEGRLSMTPALRTDFFRSPDGMTVNDNACLLSTRVSGDFTAVAHLKADLKGFGDAGAITVRESADKWAKLCLERSPKGDIAIVSVVTDGYSDDSNGELLETPECFLRITRKGRVFGMHHSLDGKTWRFSRTFTRDFGDEVAVGIHAQAPFVGGCSVEFDMLQIDTAAVGDFRSGE